MKFFYANHISKLVEEHVVVSHTKHFVTHLDGRREQKDSHYGSWHETYASAREALIRTFILRVQTTAAAYQNARDELKRVSEKNP
jgi:hypothetical protein